MGGECPCSAQLSRVQRPLVCTCPVTDQRARAHGMRQARWHLMGAPAWLQGCVRSNADGWSRRADRVGNAACARDRVAAAHMARLLCPPRMCGAVHTCHMPTRVQADPRLSVNNQSLTTKTSSQSAARNSQGQMLQRMKRVLPYKGKKLQRRKGRRLLLPTWCRPQLAARGKSLRALLRRGG